MKGRAVVIVEMSDRIESGKLLYVECGGRKMRGVEVTVEGGKEMGGCGERKRRRRRRWRSRRRRKRQ